MMKSVLVIFTCISLLAAKNKIVNLYNQFMAGPADSSSSRGAGVLETGMGNLRLSDTQQEPRQPPRPNQVPKRHSVDLYEWDGQGQPPSTTAARTTSNNALLNQRDSNNATTTTTSATSTPTAQMLSDEEFARQLAKEDAEAAETAAAVAAVHRSKFNCVWE
jgi:hypothetical protein